jgi:ABC-type cobalamin transport system ATPase subunit
LDPDPVSQKGEAKIAGTPLMAGETRFLGPTRAVDSRKQRNNSSKLKVVHLISLGRHSYSNEAENAEQKER